MGLDDRLARFRAAAQEQPEDVDVDAALERALAGRSPRLRRRTSAT